jgi:predicted ATPase
MRIACVVPKDFSPFHPDTKIFFPSKEKEGGGEVHIFAGENGTGKTRLLSVIAASCGNPRELDKRVFARIGALVFSMNDSHLGVWRHAAEVLWRTDIRKDSVESRINRVSSGNEDELQALFGNPHPSSNSLTRPPSSIPTLAMAFRGVAALQDSPIQPLATLASKVNGNVLTFSHEQSDDLLIAQSLTNLKIKSAIAAQSSNLDNRDYRMCVAIEQAIHGITGRRFQVSVETHPQVHLEIRWGDQKMTFAQLPDGLRSLIGWLVGCVARLDAFLPTDDKPLEHPAIILLDEPESHLHPAWQRRLLPAAQLLLPNAQFFVATHSPFVISSVNSGWIHVFRADGLGAVTVDKPKPCSAGDSYLDVVEDILNVPEWYDPETETLLSAFRDMKRQVLVDPDPQVNDELEKLAQEISCRSDSLRGIISRELKQLRIQLETKQASA